MWFLWKFQTQSLKGKQRCANFICTLIWPFFVNIPIFSNTNQNLYLIILFIILKDAIRKSRGEEDCWSISYGISYWVLGVASWYSWHNFIKVPQCSQGIFHIIHIMHLSKLLLLVTVIFLLNDLKFPFFVFFLFFFNIKIPFYGTVFSILGSFSSKEGQRIGETKECPKIIIPSWKACWLFSYWSCRSWYD